MKTYNEMANDVLSRIDEYNKAKQKRKLVVLRLAASLSALCLAVLVGILAWPAEEPPLSPPDTTSEKQDTQSTVTIYTGALAIESEIPDGAKGEEMDGTFWSNGQTYGSGESLASDTISSYTTSSPSIEQDNSKRFLFINEITGEATGSYKYLDPGKHYTKSWDNAMIANYLDADLIRLNAKLGEEYKYINSTHQTVTYTNEGELVDDRFVFDYKSDESKFTIITSKLGVPYDSVYLSNTEKQTRFNTAKNGVVNVLTYGTVGTLTNETLTVQKLLVADFKVNNVYYRIKAENISVDDFKKIVLDIAER